jgi:hypothetical protein
MNADDRGPTSAAPGAMRRYGDPDERLWLSRVVAAVARDASNVPSLREQRPSTGIRPIP